MVYVGNGRYFVWNRLFNTLFCRVSPRSSLEILGSGLCYRRGLVRVAVVDDGIVEVAHSGIETYPGVRAS